MTDPARAARGRRRPARVRGPSARRGREDRKRRGVRSSRCRSRTRSSRPTRRSRRHRADHLPVTIPMTTGTYPEELRALVDSELGRLAYGDDPATNGLREAMRYSVLAGGKRVRPVLALATARAIGTLAGRHPADRARRRADPHLLADPRRPPRDGRRRPAPRPPDLPQGVRRRRRDPRGRRALRRSVHADPHAPAGRTAARARGRRADGDGDRRRRHGRRPVPRREGRDGRGRRRPAPPARAQDRPPDRGVGGVRAAGDRRERRADRRSTARSPRSSACSSRWSTTSST